MAEDQPHSLRHRVFAASRWMLGAHAASQALRLAGSLALTRLLVPEMFGVMAIATVLIVGFTLFTDVGVGQSVVQSRRGEEPAFLDTAWLLQLARGGLIAALCLAASAGLAAANAAGWLEAASVYASPDLPGVVAVLALVPMLNAMQSTNALVALRRLDQRRLARLELTSQFAGFCVAVGWCWLDRSIWALVAGNIASAGTQAVLAHCWLPGPRNRVAFERAAFHELFGFGKWVFLSTLVTFFVLNGDRLLLGAYLDAGPLGLYVIGATVVTAFSGVISAFFARVAYPALSEVARRSPAELSDAHYRLRLPFDVLLQLLCGLLFAAGPLVVALLYDERYAAAGRVVAILSLSLVAVRYVLAEQVLLALGRTRQLFNANAMKCAALFTSVPACWTFGGEAAVLWALALYPLAAAPYLLYLLRQLGVLRPWKELHTLPALLAGYLAGIALNGLAGAAG